MKRLALIVPVALVLAGCGSGSEPEPRPSSVASIDIQDFRYRPARVEVAPGARVTFTNRDSAPHTATTRKAPARFDTGTLRQGGRATRTLTRAGTYAYICELHPFMTATIVVSR